MTSTGIRLVCTRGEYYIGETEMIDFMKSRGGIGPDEEQIDLGERICPKWCHEGRKCALKKIRKSNNPPLGAVGLLAQVIDY